MPVLDFQEIPEAHVANGMQDTFELFARDFLKSMGFTIIEDPDRGADGGVDLIVEEARKGLAGTTVLRWLVSCKHKATSGNSVTPQDDSNIADRVQANGCDGFLGFYSTLASAGLSGLLGGLRGNFEVQIFDREKIEEILLNSDHGITLARRYFPASLDAWLRENPEPAKLFAEAPKLDCEICGKDLFEDPQLSLVSFWKKLDREPDDISYMIERVNWTCKGACDRQLAANLKGENLYSSWEDVHDLMIPIVYIKWIMGVLNSVKKGDVYSDRAFGEIKDMLIRIYPHVVRHASAAELERVDDLGQIPDFLGGMGYGG